MREFQFIQKIQRCFDLFQKRNRFTAGQIAIRIVEERVDVSNSVNVKLSSKIRTKLA